MTVIDVVKQIKGRQEKLIELKKEFRNATHLTHSYNEMTRLHILISVFEKLLNKTGLYK